MPSALVSEILRTSLSGKAALRHRETWTWESPIAETTPIQGRQMKCPKL